MIFGSDGIQDNPPQDSRRLGEMGAVGQTGPVGQVVEAGEIGEVAQEIGEIGEIAGEIAQVARVAAHALGAAGVAAARGALRHGRRGLKGGGGNQGGGEVLTAGDLLNYTGNPSDYDTGRFCMIGGSSCPAGQFCAYFAELTRTPRRLRWVRTGYAYQPPALCTYRRRRAACPQGPTYSTYWVRVPASGVGYVPRTVAPPGAATVLSAV